MNLFGRFIVFGATAFFVLGATALFTAGSGFVQRSEAWFGLSPPSGLGDPHRPVVRVDNLETAPALVPRGEESYPALDGSQIRSDLESIIGFSRQSRAAGDRVWGRVTGFPEFPVAGKVAVQRLQPQAGAYSERRRTRERARALMDRGAVAVLNVVEQTGNMHVRDFSSCNGPCFNLGTADGRFLIEVIERARAMDVDDPRIRSRRRPSTILGNQTFPPLERKGEGVSRASS